jgi:hypothetical protein
MTKLDSLVEEVGELRADMPSEGVTRQAELASWVWLYGPSTAVEVALEIAVLQSRVDRDANQRILDEVRFHELLVLGSLEKYAISPIDRLEPPVAHQ